MEKIHPTVRTEMKFSGAHSLFVGGAIAAAVVGIYGAWILDTLGEPPLSKPVLATSEQVTTDAASSSLRERRGLLDSRGVRFEFDYTYLGKLSARDHGTILFLTKGGRVHRLSEGDLLEGMFRIESVKDDRVEVTHVATNTRITKIYSELTAPIATAKADGLPGAGTAMPRIPSAVAANPFLTAPYDPSAVEAGYESRPAATEASGGEPAATAIRPALATASTPAAPSAPGRPMQMLPPGEPIQMTIPPAGTVPPQGRHPTYPTNFVPPQGAGR